MFYRCSSVVGSEERCCFSPVVGIGGKVGECILPLFFSRGERGEVLLFFSRGMGGKVGVCVEQSLFTRVGSEGS